MSYDRTLSGALLCAALATTLPAQTAAGGGNRFVPEGSSIVLRVASPAKWREQFGTTQAAKLMQSASLAPFMEQLTSGYEMMLDEVRQSGEFDADALDGLLTKWTGDIVVSMQVDWSTISDAVQFGELPQMSVVVALTPDGKCDFGKLAEAFQTLAEDNAPSGLLQDLTVGDLTLRLVKDDDAAEPAMTLPHVIDDHLVLMMGPSLEQDAARLLGKDARYAGDLGKGPLYLHAELGGLMDTVLDMVAEAPTPFSMVGMIEAFGLGAIDSLTLSLDADGQHVAGELELGLKGDDRGLLAMMPAGTTAPRLLASVPAGAQSFTVTTFDLDPLFRTIERVWVEMEDMAPISWSEAMEAFESGAKVRLKEDLLAHLGKEMLMLQDVAALADLDPMEDEDDPAAMMAGNVFGLALADSAAFAKSLETALRARGLHVGRKTEDYGDAKVHRMTLAGVLGIEYVITDDALLIGLGHDERTQRMLRSVLDARAAGAAPLADDVQAHLAALEPGWCGVTSTPIATTLEMLSSMLTKVAEFDDDAALFRDVLGNVGKDMNRLGIGTMVSASYVSKSAIVSRFRW